MAATRLSGAGKAEEEKLRRAARALDPAALALLLSPGIPGGHGMLRTYPGILAQTGDFETSFAAAQTFVWLSSTPFAVDDDGRRVGGRAGESATAPS